MDLYPIRRKPSLERRTKGGLLRENFTLVARRTIFGRYGQDVDMNCERAQ